MTQNRVISGVATEVLEDGGDTVVKLYETNVVRFNEKRIVLNSGGYETATTKRRMMQTSNQYDLGFSVYVVKKQWFVDFKGKTIPFEDGMVLER